MAAGADSHFVTFTSRQRQCLDNVARRCTLGDQFRTFVDHSIEDRSKLLISGILCSNELHAASSVPRGWTDLPPGESDTVHTPASAVRTCFHDRAHGCRGSGTRPKMFASGNLPELMAQPVMPAWDRPPLGSAERQRWLVSSERFAAWP